jgi:poly(A) polymerase
MEAPAATTEAIDRQGARKSSEAPPPIRAARLPPRPLGEAINETNRPTSTHVIDNPADNPLAVPRIRPRSEHPISRKRIDPDALKVLYRLSTAGYKAYLVGGSVRDLLLGRQPKDFDIGTDAHPQAIKRLFRNCRLIGRRFRLAHLLFANGKVVEVATFRRRPEEAPSGSPELLMTSDNTFGTAREDALRRDFTINGLFYDISDFSVIDYVGGLDDLEAGLVRTIGDPTIRFREDPVRMMRGIEFASRLGFAITPDSYEAILECRKEILKSAPPRVTEELLQSLKGGHALPTFLLLREVGLLDALLPELAEVLREIDPDHPHGTGHLFWALLDVLDAERRRGRVFDDAVLFSLLFLPIARARVREAAPGAEPDPGLLGRLLEEIVPPAALRMSLPHAVTGRILQALGTVGRLSHRPDARVATKRIVFREGFGAALDLFQLVSMATGMNESLAAEWRTFAERALKARESLEAESEAAPRPPAGRRRRRGGRGRGRKPA